MSSHASSRVPNDHTICPVIYVNIRGVVAVFQMGFDVKYKSITHKLHQYDNCRKFPNFLPSINILGAYIHPVYQAYEPAEKSFFRNSLPFQYNTARSAVSKKITHILKLLAGRSVHPYSLTIYITSFVGLYAHRLKLWLWSRKVAPILFCVVVWNE